jgi:small glutamine-rich tetratricopeptide repeat-containing protein alpha
MQQEDYAAALRSYTSAAALDPTNPIYYSNCAAAHSQLGEHTKAIEYAKKAIQVDSSYIKAYSRLGYVFFQITWTNMKINNKYRHAHYSLDDFVASAMAYKQGLDLAPTNKVLQDGLKLATSHITGFSQVRPFPNIIVCLVTCCC